MALDTNKLGGTNSSGNPDPTDPVDHLFDGAPINNRAGRAGEPEHLPSPAGDVAFKEGMSNRDAARDILGTGTASAEEVSEVKKDDQAAAEAESAKTAAEKLADAESGEGKSLPGPTENKAL